MTKIETKKYLIVKKIMKIKEKIIKDYK